MARRATQAANSRQALRGRLCVAAVGLERRGCPCGEHAGAVLRDLRRPTRPTPEGGGVYGDMKWSRPRPPCGVPPLVRTLLGGYHSRPLWDGSREAGKGGVQRRETEGGSGSEGRRRRESRRLFIRPRGERGGCAWRGATARRTGSALRDCRPAGSGAAVGPSPGRRLPGLGGRARGSPPAPSSAPSAHKGGRSPPTAGGVGRRTSDNRRERWRGLGGGCNAGAEGAHHGPWSRPRLLRRRRGPL